METILHNPNVIRGWRAARRWTQADLSRAVKRSRYTIIRLESGESFVSLDTIIRVAASLEKPLAEALNDEGRKQFAA